MQKKKTAVQGPSRARRGPRNKRFAGAGYHGVGATTGLSKSQLGPPLSYNMEVPYTEECLGSVASAGSTFTNTTYIINPANNVTFPWLSGIAAKFEKYRFRKLHFKFVSTSADAVGSTNTALGSVLLNTNYDVLDSAFANQVQMEDYGGAAEDKPAEHQVHVVDTAGRRGGDAGARFNLVSAAQTAATEPYPTNSSAHDYDLGLFQIATVGQQAVSTLGRLYVCYQVQLIRRKIDTPLGQSILASHLASAPVHSAAAAGSAFLGTSGGVLRAGSNIAVVATSNTFTLPIAGRMLVAALWNGDTIAAVPTFSVGSNITAVATLLGNALAGQSSVGTDGLGDTTAWRLAVYDVATAGSAAANTITVTGLTGMTAGDADIYVAQISSGLTSTQHSSHVLHDELQELRDAVAELQRSRRTCDSDFEEDDRKSSDRRFPTPSPSPAPLSQSTLGLIGELIARKSNSSK